MTVEKFWSDSLCLSKVTVKFLAEMCRKSGSKINSAYKSLQNKNYPRDFMAFELQNFFSNSTRLDTEEN